VTSLGLRILLGLLLVATMILATRFGWHSAHFRPPSALRLVVVLASVALLTALTSTFKRFTMAELAVILALYFAVGMLLFPGLNGHTGEPFPYEQWLW
jgi:p-aminobenzoyl-glutamate transporter AbgT